MVKFWSAKRKRKREKRTRTQAFGTRPLMEYVRKKISQDKSRMPNLHKKALSLGLLPQPWWDVEFYEWAIQQKE